MNIKRNLLPLLISGVMTFFIPAVFASGIAVFQAKDTQNSTIKVEYLDSNTIRMNINGKDSKNSYMLVRDGKAYMVANENGQTHVMDMASLGGMAKNMGAGAGNDAFNHELISAEKTGRTEKVAGYKGDVYRMKWRDNQGTHSEDAVLSSHRNVRQYSKAWMNMADVMSRSMGNKLSADKSIIHFLENEGKGILRLGDQFIVTSIVSKNISANRFELPARPMQMPGFGGMFGAPKAAPARQSAPKSSRNLPTLSGSQSEPVQTQKSQPQPTQRKATYWREEPQQQQRQSEPQQGGLWDKFVGKKTDRQVDRQKQNTENRMDREIDNTVDKVINNALDKVFKW